jgi:TPP-dependent indolepyruvate ferredoxin oxidoreductase alpha subunit
VQAKYRTYGQFRGNQSVTTLLGNGTNEAQDAFMTLYYQGMYGGYLSPTSIRAAT